MSPGDASAGKTKASKRSGAVTIDRVLNAIDALVLIIDQAGIIRCVNGASEKEFGLSSAAMTGRSLLDLVHVSEQHAFAVALDDIKFQRATHANLTFRLAGSDHATHLVSAIFCPFSDGMHKNLLVIAFNADDRAKTPLISRLTPSLRSMGQWRYDIAARITTLSRNVKNFGQTHINTRAASDEFGLEVVHPDDREAVRAIYQYSLETGKPFFFRARSRTKSGAYRLCDSYGMVELDADGKPKALLGISYDVTQDAKESDALRDNAVQLQEVLSEISDMVYRINGRGELIYVSPSTQRVLGYDPAEMVSEKKRAIDYVHPDDRAHLMAELRALRSPGETTSVIYRGMHYDGHPVWLETTVRALSIGPSGYVSEFVSVSRDITERRRSEEALEAAYARAEAASATKSRFLANMSHELRTPLNAIIGFSDIIRRELFGPAGSPRYKEYAQLIQESGGHLLDLINDILDMSKIEAGKFDLRLETVELDELIDSCLKLLEPRAQDAKLVLSAELCHEKSFVQADRRAVKQILLNLVTNAIKFTPAGGIVTVSLESLSDGVAIQVRDTGIGIAEADLSRVTLPFEQVSSSPLLTQAGSGLGLALVQSLTTMHMGTLKIDSEPGEGTVVTVYLPADPRSRRAA